MIDCHLLKRLSKESLLYFLRKNSSYEELNCVLKKWILLERILRVRCVDQL